MDSRSGSIGRRSHHRSRHHRRKDDRTLDYDESSEGEEESGGRVVVPPQRQEFNLAPYAFDPNVYSRKRQQQQTLPHASTRDRNSLALTADESHISPIDHLDAPVQRLYSYLSGSEGEGSPCVPKVNDGGGGGEWQRQRSRTSSDSSLASHEELPAAVKFTGSRPNATTTANTLSSRTGENFYSRISDDSTLPRPNIFIPPPPSDPGPPMPPRLPFSVRKTNTSGTQTIDRQQPSLIAGRQRDDDVTVIDFRPQFLATTPGGCVFVPTGHPPSPAASPVLSAIYASRRLGLGNHGAPASSSSAAAILPQQNRASVLVDAGMDINPQQWSNTPSSQTNNSASTMEFIGARPANVARRTTLQEERTKDRPRSLYNSSASCQVKKELRERCTWKCIAFVMILVTLILSAAIAYLIAMKMQSVSWSVDDRAKVILDEDNAHTTVAYVQTIPASGNELVALSSVVTQYPFGRQLEQQIPAHSLWKMQFYLPEAQFIKFNFSVEPDAVIGTYGRRNIQPSHTQYDFFHVVDGHKTSRTVATPRREKRDSSSTGVAAVVESAFVEYMELGLWYFFVYNDCDQSQDVAFIASKQSGLITGCPKSCHGRGDCVNGSCRCFPGYSGLDCMQSTCPVLCQGHGQYVSGLCRCFKGWKGPECETSSTDCEDPDCSGNGICVEGSCTCSPGYAGVTCAEELCILECARGRCHRQQCICEEGWTGELCNVAQCDNRCTLNGQCNNGSCLCNTGWNGKHCTISGCPQLCGSHGQCQLHQSTWKCVCDEGWTGTDCRVALEIICDDNLDDDQDKLTDCQDPDCCLSASCRGSPLCNTAPDPMQILLRKQPPSSTASFYDRMRFLIEDDSVQSYSTLSSFNQSQVSVVRGKVVNADGIPLIGVRVNVVTQPLYGFTLTRELGLFDMLVNGGGSVTIRFQRQLFRIREVTVMVPWNRMVTMDTVTLTIEGQNATAEEECPRVEHDRYNTWPVVLSTWQHSQLGACPLRSTIIPESQVLQESVSISGTDLHLVYHSSQAPGYMSTLMIQLTHDVVPVSLVFVHLQVHVEGLVYEELFEAEPNLKYKFAWDRRNAYNQKVFGIVSTNVNVGYQYKGCGRIFWEKQSTTLSGYAITSSDIGTWNLNIHHTYNFQEGILHKGDGTNIYLKERPRKVVTILGNGRPRRSDCRGCDGKAEESRLLAPVALASGRDGSLYIGDYNHIRKLGASREEVASIMQLSMSEVPYKYYMTVSPLDGKLYISDHKSLTIVRVKTMGAVRDMMQNFEVIAGTGDQCVPGDAGRCGDGRNATEAHLLYPKGIAINKDGVVYFADGANIRTIDVNGRIETIIGSQGQPKYWQPLPCNKIISTSEVTLHWPTALAVNPLDDTVHIVDNNMILKVTSDRKVVIVAGRPLHCPPKNVTGRSLLTEEHSGPRLATEVTLDHLQHISFAPNGDLYLVESDGRRLNQIRMVNTDGEIVHYAGAQSRCDCRIEECKCFNAKEELAVNMLLSNPTAVTITPDSVLHIADMGNLRIHSVLAALPTPDRLGQYEVLYPQTQDLYVFNRFGQHVATKSLVTDRYVYNFTFNVNSYYGKLMKVVDGNGSALVIRRDYKLLAKEMLFANRRICRFAMDNMGQLQTFVAADNFTATFSYIGNSGLIESKQTSRGHLFLYEYDGHGRLEAVVHPTGRKTRIGTDVDQSGALVRIDADSRRKVTMATNRNVLSLQHGEDYAIQVSNLKDGSLTLEYPFRMAVTLETSPHPLLSTEHQLTVKRKIILPNGLLHRLDWRYYLRHEGVARRGRVTTVDKVGRRMRVGKLAATRHDAARLRHGELALHAPNPDAPYWGYEGKILSINGEPILTFEYDRDENMEIVLNRHHDDILAIAYDNSGRPVQITPKDPLESLNLTYDSQGHLVSWIRGEFSLSYIYDDRTGQLIEKRIANRILFRYIYKNGYKPTDVILPSGKQYQVQYDEFSNIRAIILPSSARHTFHYVSMPDVHRISYYPPGISKPYILDYNTHGQLTQVFYPSNHRRISHFYNEHGLPSRTIYDWTDVHRHYDSSTLKLDRAVIENRGPQSYSCSLSYGGAGEALVTSHSTVCTSDDLEFLKAEFRYEYDNHFRLVSLEASFDKRPSPVVQVYNYSAETGRLTALSSFRFDHPNLHREVMSDKNVEVTDELDKFSRLADEWYSFNDYIVFSKEVKYDGLGRIYQWRRKIGSSDLKAYEYVYDIDGNIVEVLINSQVSWKYEIDANGNIVKITHHSSVQNVVINQQNQIESSGQLSYVVDRDGFVVQRDREVFEYNALGLLVRAFKSDAFDARFYYDAENRLTATSDAEHSPHLQFFYADPRVSERVTHVYDHSTQRTMELFYSGRGRLFAIRQDEEYFYVCLDPQGSPILILNAMGSVVKQITYDPLGGQISDSAPEFLFPFGFRCGVFDPATRLVLLGSRAYDPWVGRWMTPDYHRFVENVGEFTSSPEMANLYQNSNLNPRYLKSGQLMTGIEDWLSALGYDYDSLVPAVNFEGEIRPRDDVDPQAKKNRYHLMSTVSAFHCAFEQDMENMVELSTVPRSRITVDPDKELNVGRSFAPTSYLFSTGVVISTQTDGRVAVLALESADSSLANLSSILLNDSYSVGIRLTSQGHSVSYFVKSHLDEVTDDLQVLGIPPGGSVIHGLNVSVSRDTSGTPKYVDVLLRGDHASVNVRYGSTVASERRRVLREAERRAVDAAWLIEREILQSEKHSINDWTKQQRDELLSSGRVANMGAVYIRDVSNCPEIADDPKNIKFVPIRRR